MRTPRPDDPAACLQALAIKLHQNPSLVNVGDSFRVQRRYPMRVHAHADVLHLDLVIGCTGHFVIDGVTTPIRGTTALALYPGTTHGHELLPAAGATCGERLILKIRVDPAWPAVKRRLFEPISFPVQGELMLLRAMRRATRLSGLRAPGVLHAARVVEVLCLWPGAAQSFLVDSAGTEPELDRAMRAVLQSIEQRLVPPSVEDLAEMAGLSTRHFTRRFSQAMGVPPRTFIEARRLERARAFLLQGDMSVGEAGAALGFGSISAFSRWFSSLSGTSPSRYRAV